MVVGNVVINAIPAVLSSQAYRAGNSLSCFLTNSFYSRVIHVSTHFGSYDWSIHSAARPIGEADQCCSFAVSQSIEGFTCVIVTYLIDKGTLINVVATVSDSEFDVHVL